MMWTLYECSEINENVRLNLNKEPILSEGQKIMKGYVADDDVRRKGKVWIFLENSNVTSYLYTKNKHPKITEVFLFSRVWSLHVVLLSRNSVDIRYALL